MTKVSPKSLLVTTALLLIFRVNNISSQPIPEDLVDVDSPEWHLQKLSYIDAMTPNNSIQSDRYTCEQEDIFLDRKGNLVLNVERHVQPLSWGTYLSVTTKIIPLQFLLQKQLWPEILMPFLFCLMTLGVALVTIIPILAIGGIAWALVFTVRFIGHPRIRKCIRSLLIRKEKVNRWYYEKAYPPQHLRKFQERHRYQLPVTFQDPDISSDDEPAELELGRRRIARQKTTMWSKREILLLGFDPDNIKRDLIYGDLFGNSAALAPAVKHYLEDCKRNKRSIHSMGLATFKKSIGSDEWAELLKLRAKDHSRQDVQVPMTPAPVSPKVKQLASVLTRVGSKDSKTPSQNSMEKKAGLGGLLKTKLQWDKAKEKRAAQAYELSEI